MNQPKPAKKSKPVNGPTEWGLSAVFAVVGAAIGFAGSYWLASRGMKAVVLPGVLLGLGAGLPLKAKSPVCAVLCCGAAIMLGVLTEWKLFPFVADESLGFFLRNVFSLPGQTLVIISLGGIFAAWFGFGRDKK